MCIIRIVCVLCLVELLIIEADGTERQCVTDNGDGFVTQGESDKSVTALFYGRPLAVCLSGGIMLLSTNIITVHWVQLVVGSVTVCR